MLLEGEAGIGKTFLWEAGVRITGDVVRVLRCRPAATTIALLLVSAVRLRERLDGGTATALYLAGLGALLVTIVVVTAVEESRVREL